MKKKTTVRVDSRNRICLTKVTKELPTSFNAYIENGRIILEPLVEIPAHEAWIYEPENREILKNLKESLKETETFDLGSFAQYLKD